MRRETTIKGASFTGTSDLTIVAPIRKGFVPSLDAVTYKTRVKRVLKSLHLGRQTAHEYDLARVMSDAVERVGRIHSIRIAIIESENRVTPEDKVVLAVTFDGSWKSYIRVIWQKVSRSLDLIFCNTDDYVTGWEHSFEEWCVWLRAHHAEAPFLYSTPNLSYQDTQYLRTFERRQRVVVDPRDPDDPGKADLASTRIQIATAEAISDEMAEKGTDPTNLKLDQPMDVGAVGRPAFRQGMRGLAGLYGLVPLHFDARDGQILHRAACELLREFLPMVNTDEGRLHYQAAIAFAELRFLDALNWLRFTPSSDRLIPPLPDAPDDSEHADVQGGIIAGYPGVSDGCLLMLAFDSAQGLGDFLARVVPTPATASLAEGDIAVNIALTLQGLRLAGLSDDEVAALPEEFVQGMERRAGMLGDVRVNHPRRWRLPALNWSLGTGASDVREDDPCPRVDLSSIDLVLQLRIRNSTLSGEDARALLLARYTALSNGLPHAPRPLSLQWMQRLSVKAASGADQTREHFGFLDSQSQPVLARSEAGRKFSNQIHLGEILLGHDNAADAACKPDERSEVQKLLHNGSFLVVRKLRQDIEAMECALALAAKDTLAAGATPDEIDAQRLLLLGKMVGRWPIGHREEGRALANATPGNDNDFSFDRDREGALCPFHAHIRRANPRDNTEPEPPGARPARLIRRGMSYGPVHDPRLSEPAARAASLASERGMIFMAYNASIGEQFEVIQRWLTGGNSSGSYSGQSDPLLGIAEPGRPRYFRFEHKGATVRVALDGSNRMHDEPRPFVRLEWGMYLFTPSVPALRALAIRAQENARRIPGAWSVDAGEREIARLRQIEHSQGSTAAFVEWKTVIEDPTSAADFTTASVWAAIRKNHGGVLDTPFGVLVASADLVDEVLNDRARNLTATGYLPRMHRSFGQLYLGMDAGQIDGAYELESVDMNAAIMGLVAQPADFQNAVAEAARVTIAALGALARQAGAQAAAQCELHWEVTFEAREVIDEVLAHFCEKWFGLSEAGGFLKRSGMRWNWAAGETPCYPGHFMAPSRYTFQPHPGPEVEETGSKHGLAVRIAVTRYLEALGAGLTAQVARAALDCDAARRDATYPARTLAGVLMGFLPTTDGNIRRVLNEWLNEGTLWALRAQHRAMDSDDAVAQDALEKRLRAKFVAAMQLRAAPELLWRTAARGHEIGRRGRNAVAVRPGRIVIASLISATQECMERGDPSLDYAFGGRRKPNGPHPTHACPGYGPATAVMLGFFRGLVECGLPLRPGPAALSFSMGGVTTLPGACPGAVAAKPARSGTFGPTTRPPTPGFAPLALHGLAPRPVRLLAIGDSWLYDYALADGLGLASSLTTELKSLGFDIDTTFCKTGRTLAEMAQPAALRKLAKVLANLEGDPDAPRAILIGGGGNDLVYPPDEPEKTRLYGVLVERAASAQTGLVEAAVAQFVDVDLKNHYFAILDVVTAGTGVPILIHAYDYPVPDGRPSVLGPGPWLKKVFDARKIPRPSSTESTSTEIMKILIRRLNAMVGQVAGRYPGQVHALNLDGTLEQQADYATAYENYTRYWANELHANDPGFDILALAVKAKLAALNVR